MSQTMLDGCAKLSVQPRAGLLFGTQRRVSRSLA